MDVTGISIAEAQRIENASVIGARINEAGQLIFTKGDGVTEFNAGQVVPNSWPVGSIFIHTSSTSPATLLALPNSTWERYGKGRALVSVNETDTEFAASGTVFGAKKHKLTKPEMPAHAHVNDPHNHIQNPHAHGVFNNNTQAGNEGLSGGAVVGTDAQTVAAGSSFYAAMGLTGQVSITNTTATNQQANVYMYNEGGDGEHNNIQPSIAVYVWRRTG